jgi:hypothetical protein
LSIIPQEIAHFYHNLDEITNDDINKILNIHQDQRSGFDYLEIKRKYEDLKKFRQEYLNFHNAIKHGWRFKIFEMSTKDKPMNSMHGTYVDFEWVGIQGKPSEITVKAFDGSETQIKIRDRKVDGVLLPCDDISQFVGVAKNCFSLIEDILKAHSPKA